MTNSSSFPHVLLSNFKSIVELIVKFPGDCLTTQYGAIERIRSCILAILTHGFKLTNGDFYERLWHFVLAITANSVKYIQLLQDIYQDDNFHLTIQQWIDQSVITQCLAEQISSLENNDDLLENYYHSHAFIRLKPFYQAFIICLRTIQSCDPTLLTTIDPKLTIISSNETIDTTSRSYSTNENQFKPVLFIRENSLHRRNHSDPIFHFETKSNHSTDIYETNRTNSIEYGSSYDDSQSDSFLSIEQTNLNESIRQIQLSQLTLIEPNEEQQFQQIITSQPKISIIKAHLPHSSLFWPKKNQTLDNYLRECDSQTRTAVEKENAHFYFSEAVLAAIEYIRFSQKCKQYFEPIDKPSLTINEFERDTIRDPDNTTAEHIALAIMETWKHHRIPTADELFCLMPHGEEIVDIEETTTIESHPDETMEPVLQRGTPQWAPPREQLITVIHPSISRDTQLKKQDYLCAGCGRAIEKAYASRCRYCEYTGKYFCRSCHSDKKFYLPSYLIIKWEFSNKHSVSNFAYDFLKRIYTEPIFNLHDLNSKLFETSNKLRIVNGLRWALFSLRYYILTCRFADEKGHQKLLRQLPSHIYENPYMYSMDDIIRTKSRELHRTFEPIVNALREHVITCAELCYAKGFICEICQNEKDIIFPFDISTTSVCSICQSCFHIQCHRSQKFACPKCQRARHRNSISVTTNRAIP